MIFEYCWGNNEERKKLQGRKCKVLYRGPLNSCWVQFIDGDREMHCISRYALKKVKEKRD